MGGEAKKKIKIASDDVLSKFDNTIEDIGVKEKEKRTVGKASQLGVPYIDLSGVPIPQDALSLISREEAQKNKVVCFFYGDRNIKIGAVNPEQKGAQGIINKIKEKFF